MVAETATVIVATPRAMVLRTTAPLGPAPPDAPVAGEAAPAPLAAPRAPRLAVAAPGLARVLAGIERLGRVRRHAGLPVVPPRPGAALGPAGAQGPEWSVFGPVV